MLPNLSGLGLGAPTGPMLAVTDREKVTCMITQEEFDLGAYAWFLNVYVSGDSGPTEQLPHPYNVLALAEWLKDNRTAPDTNQIVTEVDRVNCINTARVLEEYAREVYARAPAPEPAPEPAPAPPPQVEWPLPLSVSPPASPGRGNGDSPRPGPRSNLAPGVQAKLDELQQAVTLARQERDEALARRGDAAHAENRFRRVELQEFNDRYRNDMTDNPWASAPPEVREVMDYRAERFHEAVQRAGARAHLFQLRFELALAERAWYTERTTHLRVVAGQLRALNRSGGYEPYQNPELHLGPLRSNLSNDSAAEVRRRRAAIQAIANHAARYPRNNELQRQANSPSEDFGDPEFYQHLLRLSDDSALQFEELQHGLNPSSNDY